MTTAKSPRMRQRIRQRRQIGNSLAAQPAQLDQKKLRRIVGELRNILDRQARQIKEERNLLDHINRLIKVSRKGAQR